MQCPHCQMENAGGAKFCNACGKALRITEALAQTVQICPRCQSPNVVGARFCKLCGVPLASEADPEVTQLHVALPAAVDADATLISVAASPTPAPAPRPASARPATTFESPAPTSPSLPAAKPAGTGGGLWLRLAIGTIALLVLGGGSAWYFMQGRKAAELPPPALEIPREAPPASSLPPVPTSVMPAEPEKVLPPLLPSSKAEPITPPVRAESEKPSIRPAPRQPKRAVQAVPLPSPPAVSAAPPQAPTLPAWRVELQGALDYCAPKSGFSKMLCIEKARNKHCPGHWDVIKDCESHGVDPKTNL